MKNTFLIVLILLSCPLYSEELTVYTSRKEHLIKDIFKKYEKQSGVKINYKTGKAGALIQNLIAEKENPIADIFMTVDAGNLWFASHEGLLAPVNSKSLESSVPAHLRDDNKMWFGLSVRARTMVVNTKKFPKGEKISYESLGDRKWRNGLCLRTSKKVYNQSLIAMLIDTHGYKKARIIVNSWMNNTVDIFSNDTAVIKALAAGQCTIGIVNTYYFGRYMKKSPDSPLKIVWPNQKSYGVHVNVSGAGIVKGSKKFKAAQKFLEWLASSEAQKEFAEVNMEYPVLKETALSKIVKDWGTFKGNNEFHLTKAGKLQKKAIKLSLEVGYK